MSWAPHSGAYSTPRDEAAHGDEDAAVRENLRRDAGETNCRDPPAGLARGLWPLRPAEGGGAVLALFAMRRAVLPGALPAAEQHPGLAEADRRGAAGGGLRDLLGHQLDA